MAKRYFSVKGGGGGGDFETNMEFIGFKSAGGGGWGGGGCGGLGILNITNSVWYKYKKKKLTWS